MKSYNLNSLIESCHESLKVQMDTIAWENPVVYQWWLAQSSYLVNHTTRLICYATAHVPTSDPHGFKHWLDHLNEEKNHEVLLEKDLASFGAKFGDFVELSATSLIYQNQYYWIQKAFPSTLLGYSFLMEGFAAKYGGRYYSRMEKAHGLKASNFVRVHVKEDVSHFKSGLKFLESLSSEQMEPLIKNMQQSQLLYRNMLMGITEEIKNTTRQSA